MHFFTRTLAELRHETTKRPIVQIRSRLPGRRLRSVGEQSDAGSTISLLVYGVSTQLVLEFLKPNALGYFQPDGELLPNSFIEYAATMHKISLRTGCVCNPGGAAALLGIEEDMRKLYPGVTRKDLQCHMGRELGVVRISLGLASNFQDVWRVLEFFSLLGKGAVRQTMWKRWMESKSMTS
jgi:selenocysteine lyase/cysteine desulfurase